MASPENLRLRISLIGRFDQLASRLEDGDETAIEPAHDHIRGLLASEDMPTLALAMHAFAGILTDMQEAVDAERGIEPDQ